MHRGQPFLSFEVFLRGAHLLGLLHHLLRHLMTPRGLLSLLASVYRREEEMIEPKRIKLTELFAKQARVVFILCIVEGGAGGRCYTYTEKAV